VHESGKTSTVARLDSPGFANPEKPYIYEDPVTGEPAFPIERNWQSFKPSTKQEGEARYANRAALWVNKRHAAQ
jgi:hypothetical protein